MGIVMKQNGAVKAFAGLLLGCVIVILAGCGADVPKVIKASVSAEDQQAAERSTSEHDSEEYAKSISEQNGPR
ncbi:MAG TPA: hypothetical protein DEF45_03295 [Rhodopirellula sp.]|nr:hypothetical protein [Rhodopirellula sp.]